ncbi:S8 family peptidase [Nostoc sphaeroides]|uniref:Peptidase S8/S53 subtilisin kexin sedolisin n=1 Tax=Nostoc sphaeroides CCNUC1 TaxID=2653204 RepID=A0A5P8W692_9NOSO|nr:S8 family peptidase [Nostoc sphaeroides]QFS48021.1 peptidase S8/S53 subtilisin kexin sedolisin [Nostoc sphaeroides CCNUC1]
MLIDDVNNNVLSTQQLNITSISSLDSFNTKDDYSLNFSRRSSYNSANADVQLLNNGDSENSNNATNNGFSTQNYNSTNGYGLINGAAAVARAIGQNAFADVPNLGGNNWGADLVKAPEVWAQGYTGKGVVVAVVDTGVDYNHEDLKNNIWTNTKEIAGNGIDDDGNGYIDDNYGWNFSDKNNNTLDNNGHGTHVSGTIAGENNNYGVTGIAYNAKIMPVKVLDSSGAGSYSSISKGIRYAVDNGANVINLSLGGTSSNRTLESAINYASSKGVIVVMAAGNNGDSSPAYPARYASKSGIAVGAVDKNNNLADFSNRSGTNEISYVTAPGVEVYSSVPNNQYATYSGTSMAAPHVAGIVALMLSANPNLTDAQVRQIVTETAGNSTQSTNYNVSSVASQAMSTMGYAKVDTAENSSQARISSFSNFNISNVSSLARQVISGNNSLAINTQIGSFLTPETISSFKSYDVGSLIGQAITKTAEYLTPETIASFKSYDVGSLIGQAITKTAEYLTPETIASFKSYDVGSLIGQAITKTAEYLTPETIASFKSYDVASLIGQAMSTTGYVYTETAKYLIPAETNNGLANSELWLQFQNYENLLGIINVDSNNED